MEQTQRMGRAVTFGHLPLLVENVAASEGLVQVRKIQGYN